MTTPAPPPELTAEVLIGRIERQELPPQAVLLAARGFLPLPQEELVEVLLFLSAGSDGELAGTARQSLAELPPGAVIGFARSSTNPEALDRLATATRDVNVVEAVLRSRMTSDGTVERLAATAPVMLQELIVNNQERILRCPSILDALLANSTLSPDVRRRVMENREEFFQKRQIGSTLQEIAAPAEPLHEEEELSAEAARELAELLEAAAEQERSGVAVPVAAVPDEVDPSSESAWTKILNMTVSQKVQLAFKGAASERSILVRERNKLICRAVIRSPRLTDTEVETFAGMRNVDEEVLRMIGTNRTWMAKYSIMLTLAKNPKSPIALVLPLINRLNLRDLKSLATDKGISEAVRTSAKRLYVKRRTQ
jgi:hypothetical protein